MLFLVSDSWMYSWYITTGSLINHSSYHIKCTLLSLIVERVTSGILIIYLNMNHTSWTFLSLIVECITSGSLISPLRVSDLLSLSRQHLAAQLSPTKYRQYRISIFRILAIQSLCIQSPLNIGNTEFLYFGSRQYRVSVFCPNQIKATQNFYILDLGNTKSPFSVPTKYRQYRYSIFWM